MLKHTHHIGKQEKIAAWSVLILLTGIGAAIFLAQFRNNPAVESISVPNKASSGGQSLQAIVAIPDTLNILSAPEQFDDAGLSDKIDGKAELYLSAGFKQLQCQRFSEKGKSDLWLEIFAFEMKNPSAAYAVFSTQRREDAQPLALSQFAYHTRNAVYLTHGSYYIEIVASSPSETLLAGMESILKNFIQSRQSEKTVIAEADLFPKEGLAQESITLMASDVFGYDALNHVFTAKYTLDNTDLTAFLSKRERSEEAEKLVSGYSQFLINFGGKEASLSIEGCKIIEIMDNYELMCSQGNIFFGIHEAQNKASAEKLLGLLKMQIREISPKQP